MAIEVVFCADGNKRFAQIAIEAGFIYGAQLPSKVYFSPEFADQNWKKPNLEKYTAAVKTYKPRMATVLDWERWEQLPEVLAWAETIAPYVETIIIIPKVPSGVSRLPYIIGGKQVRLGYSVPTSYGGTLVPVSEFLGWPLHLLGGHPVKQASLAGLHLRGNPQLFPDIPKLNVVSVDGNYHLKMATRHSQYFCPDGSARYAKNRFWPTLRESNGGEKWGDGSATADAPYEAFRRSCRSIMRMWNC